MPFGRTATNVCLVKIVFVAIIGELTLWMSTLLHAILVVSVSGVSLAFHPQLARDVLSIVFWDIKVGNEIATAFAGATHMPSNVPRAPIVKHPEQVFFERMTLSLV